MSLWHTSRDELVRFLLIVHHRWCQNNWKSYRRKATEYLEQCSSTMNRKYYISIVSNKNASRWLTLQEINSKLRQIETTNPLWHLERDLHLRMKFSDCWQEFLQLKRNQLILNHSIFPAILLLFKRNLSPRIILISQDYNVFICFRRDWWINEIGDLFFNLVQFMEEIISAQLKFFNAEQDRGQD